MPLTLNELENFHRFAAGKLENGGVPSLEECLRQWRETQFDEETIASIRRGLAQADAGLCRPLEEVDADIRAQLGFPVRK